MTTEFRFEHVFRVPSTTAMLEAYFDPDHLAAQDVLAELGGRTVIESTDEPAIRRCTWRVGALKPLPFFARPLVPGGKLQYLETMTWRRADDEIDLVIKPEILGGRVQIAAVYQLAQIGEGQVRRRYAGTITVDVRLVAGKIERGVLAEIEKGMPIMTKCTQDWLDRARPA
ncbi:MAG: DUF2505 family protein [Deltaproteobacteria bacterium]|nr:DUF2505 family protein [Deltaproteobacteria bacterium]MDQ3299525.1 DUF2505 domain-containing protein [Myxococcota bacterium]